MQTLTAALDSFIEAKEAGNRAPKTLEKYQRTVNRLIETIGDVTIDQITPQQLRGYLAGIKKAGAKPETLLTYYTTLKTFFEWCHKEYKTDGIMENIERPKIPRKLPPYLALSEVAAIMSAAYRARVSAKAVVIVRLLLETGIRAGELCELSRDHVDLERLEIRVTGKDKEERLLPIGSRTAAAIKRYWAGRIDSIPTAVHGYEGPLTICGLRSLIRRLAKSAGITRRVYPHLLRHTFAHLWIVGGGDVESLRRILGHSNLSTTQRYAGLDIEDIREKHTKIIHI